MIQEKNNIKKFTQEQKDAAKLGAEGGLGLVAGTVGRLAKAFGNTAKQYLKGFKKPKPKSTFKPFHRDGRIYDRQAINDAFKARFKPEIKTVTKKKGILGGTSYGTNVTPSKTTNFGRPDATVQMRNAMRNSGQYPKSDPFRGAPGLR